MKKLFFIIFVFTAFNLYAQTEVGRVIWEFKSFPERKILELEFSTTLPPKFAYSKGCINDNLWESIDMYPDLAGMMKNYIGQGLI